MKLFTPLLLFSFLCFAGFAQQRPQHTQYVQNNFVLNPAVAGIESYIDIRSSYRSQWVGLEGAPTTYYTSLNASINKNDRNILSPRERRRQTTPFAPANRNNRFLVKPHHGLGAIMQLDKSGLLKTFSLNLSYAYHLPLTQEIKLSGGISAGLMQYRLNKNDLNMRIANDPYVAGEIGNMNKFDLGVGLWLYSPAFYMGLSSMQILRSETLNNNRDPQAALQKHYYATGGLRLRLTHDLTFTPSVMAKVAESGLSMVDVNAKAVYNERFWAGASYRQNDAVAGMVGVFLNHMLDVSYSYDITTSELNRVSNNTHEVVVGLNLNNVQKLICPAQIW
ncbi:type IX secretion system PorP/SprF family membrane protein [Pontibacter ummariensis]|uniref:Type IX secretion system membrane protein, PorP/SprF family n=1 Tax=Pontibacter ummariensis TaxID=1610492 RepID=A0A239K6B3_9BACT|nr:type IX secretion system membrane protein PorP/SprF [Pontibacter ummariensis]PRY06741.1 type IX secretion system PorP/SprF family membrane protein [Pontibacter ummariensis]SNT13500.1 type IX secretion system membrane protein, PorP/SprF family [Pontibacter ummariensis]